MNKTNDKRVFWSEGENLSISVALRDGSMGVNLADIVEAESKTLKDFQGKKIAIDAHNALYQFLSIIRQPDGTPLKDSQGRVTSHLSGLLYRTSNLVEFGIKPVFVFDGIPPELKFTTIKERKEIRERAKEEWRDALERGDIERARMKAQQSARLTNEMIDEAKELLSSLGIPWVQAPSEGEAQASYLARKGEVWATASQDFDSLLFGAPMLVRNLTVTGRRKLPRKNVYVNIMPEAINFEYTLRALGITREQLIDVGILVGTDFNEGIKGIGPKKALKLIKEHGSLEKVFACIDESIEEFEEIRRIFLEPDVTGEYEIKWGRVDEGKVKEFLCGEHNFSESRVSNALRKFSEARDEDMQKSLDAWLQ